MHSRFLYECKHFPLRSLLPRSPVVRQNDTSMPSCQITPLEMVQPGAFVCCSLVQLKATVVGGMSLWPRFHFPDKEGGSAPRHTFIGRLGILICDISVPVLHPFCYDFITILAFFTYSGRKPLSVLGVANRTLCGFLLSLMKRSSSFHKIECI